MAYLYGDENQKVDIEQLSAEQLDNIKNKLSNAAIELIVDIKPVITNINTETHTEIIYHIPTKNTEETSKLEEYSLINKKENLYDIRFKIMDYI